jgi:hypothetical protein
MIARMSELPDTYLLLPASKRPQTRAQLMKALVPKVKTLFTEVCLWDDEWEVGDYRFCVISYDLPGDVHVFFQFWSEPDDAVMWEISSGKWYPPTEPYIAGSRAARIEAAGFEMGGEAENYQKEVETRNARDVNTLARQVVAQLYDALDYRGQQDLLVQAVADSRATLRPVYESIDPDDLAKILELAGYECEFGDEEDENADGVSMFVRRHGIRAAAILTAEAPDTGGFEIIALGLDRPSSEGKTRSPTPDRAEMRLLWLAGGVTASWLEHQFADWFEEQRREKRKAASGSRAARPKTSESVH